jgi:uncharacterized membrane protein YecN with MAPEG domain
MSLVLAAPALPLHKAGPYVAAAYIVFVAIVLIYLAIMAVRLTRTQHDLARLEQEMRAAREAEERESEFEALT